MILMALMIKYLQHEKIIAIYVTQMQPVSGIYDGMKITTIILNGNVQLTFYVGLSALDIILVLTFSF